MTKFSMISKTIYVALMACFITLQLQAQTEPAPAGRATPAASATDKKERHVENLAKDLNLTPEQQAQFKKTDEAYATQKKARKEAKKEDMEKMRAERIKAHKAVLTADQIKKYDEILAKREARHTEKPQGKGGKKGRKPMPANSNQPAPPPVPESPKQ